MHNKPLGTQLMISMKVRRPLNGPEMHSSARDMVNVVSWGAVSPSPSPQVQQTSPGSASAPAQSAPVSAQQPAKSQVETPVAPVTVQPAPAPASVAPASAPVTHKQPQKQDVPAGTVPGIDDPHKYVYDDMI